MENSRPKFILNTITAWDEPPRSRHQVAKELINYGDVYFITRNIKGKKGFQILKHESITYIIPSWYVDYRLRYRLPIVNELYQQFLIKIMATLNLFDGVIITFDHTAYRLIKKFKRSVYYCSDEHIGNSGINLALLNRYHFFTEKKICSFVSICIASSEYLYQKLLRYNNHTYLLPLGAPVFYIPAVYLKKNSRDKIKVCYVGFMESRKTDNKIIMNIITSGEFEFVVVGKINNHYKKLLYNKAILAGIKKGNELYNIIQESDVCIIPYKLSGINKGVTPNKYWLYTSIGKPVVSVNIPNITKWPTERGLLYLADRDNFTSVIKKAYAEDSIEKFNNRILYSKENSWEVRIKKFMSLLEL
ncbi:MAG: hypothetical protein ABIN97_09110 [Ginsengibacter sp.]